MNARLLAPACLTLVLLSGCGDTAPLTTDADDPAAGAVPPTGASPSGPPDGPRAAAALPREFIVSTNEPFWQARVEQDVVVLDGPGVQGRRFAIEGREAGAGGDVVTARDDAGTITVGVSPGSCQDSMSGAEFPLSGTLGLDGDAPVAGCARPAGMAPPRPSGD